MTSLKLRNIIHRAYSLTFQTLDLRPQQFGEVRDILRPRWGSRSAEPPARIHCWVDLPIPGKLVVEKAGRCVRRYKVTKDRCKELSLTNLGLAPGYKASTRPRQFHRGRFPVGASTVT